MVNQNLSARTLVFVSPSDFLTKMILGRALTLASGSFSANKAEQRVRLASTNCANRNSDGLVAAARAKNPNGGWGSWGLFWFFLDKQKES